MNITISELLFLYIWENKRLAKNVRTIAIQLLNITCEKENNNALIIIDNLSFLKTELNL